jgi:peptidoglycan/xylan/chitin deacetylase (PgdA/CDA1 family)
VGLVSPPEIGDGVTLDPRSEPRAHEGAGRGPMAEILTAILGRVPLTAIRRVARRPLTSVFYHLVSDEPLPHVAPLYSYKSRAGFERDLEFLSRHYALVGHDEVLAAAEGRAALPPDAAQVSFDDGFAECHDVVRPLLLKHGVPCTFFLVPGLLDNRALMHRNAAACLVGALPGRSDGEVSRACAALARDLGVELDGRAALRRFVLGLRWPQAAELDAACRALAFDPRSYAVARRPYLTLDQVRRLRDDGFTLGAHTLDHPELDALPWATAERQIVESCRLVAGLAGRARVPFAITFNGVTLDRDRLDALRSGSGVVDLVYDTNNLREERPWIVNRIACDSAAGDRPGRSNLEDVIRSAHLLEPARELARRLKGRPR